MPSTIIAPSAGPPFRSGSSGEGRGGQGTQQKDSGWDWKKGRPRRNPVLAEKTPRHDFRGWDYSAPPAQYPQYTHKDLKEARNGPPALSILHMFRSQQQKIQEEEARKKLSDERVRQHEEERAQRRAAEAARAAEAERIAAEQRRLEAERVAREAMRTPEEDQFAALALALCSNRDEDEHPRLLDTKATKKAKSHSLNGSSSASSNKYLVHRPQPNEARNLNDLPASSIRSLEKSHPMVMSQYRLNRAKAYLQTAPSPESPPPPRDVQGRSGFRPAGNLTRSASSELHWAAAAKKAKAKDQMLASAGRASLGISAPNAEDPSSSSGGGESDLMGELRRVQKQLEDTEKDIERQRLRIALNKKTKTYEKKSTSTGSP